MLVCIAAMDVTGCALEQRPLTASVANSLKGRRIALAARRRTPFEVIEPGKSCSFGGGAFGAAIAAAAMADAGERILREYTIVDPAQAIAQPLGEDLQRRCGLAPAPNPIRITGDDARQIKAAHPSADLILDVQVNDWSLKPFLHFPRCSPKDRLKYHLGYAARVRLIDAKDGVEIAHGKCRRDPEETPSTPTYDEFVANGGERLKAELESMARFCVDEFRSKVLTPPPS